MSWEVLVFVAQYPCFAGVYPPLHCINIGNITVDAYYKKKEVVWYVIYKLGAVHMSFAGSFSLAR